MDFESFDRLSIPPNSSMIKGELIMNCKRLRSVQFTLITVLLMATQAAAQNHELSTQILIKLKPGSFQLLPGQTGGELSEVVIGLPQSRYRSTTLSTTGRSAPC